jgi:hypothetical protein
MKRIISLPSAISMIAMLTIALSLSSCKKDGVKQEPLNNSDLTETNSVSGAKSMPIKVDLIHIYTDVEDANMMPPTGDNTLLFDHTGHAPVLAPDGHHVTLGEFNQVSGWADVKCINTGTHIVVHLTGMIPNGVYTIWIMTLKSPGFDGTLASFGANLNGVGALGASDGSQNVLSVNGQGNADLSVTMPAGSLSLFGSVPNCFSGVFEVLLSAAYHLDGMTHGPSPGDFSNYVLQFGFPIMGANLANTKF